jgi:hypothetical protein
MYRALSVTIHLEREVALRHAEGDLFGGHWIAVSTDSELHFHRELECSGV